MASHHRKFLLVDTKPKDEKKDLTCFTCYAYISPPPPQLPPQPPPPPPPASPKYHMSTNLILILCVLGATFIVISYLSIRRYRSRNSRRRNSGPLENSAREDFIDENRGPVVDHPIWYIRTVGLHQSIIDSIAVFKYKMGEGLIEGTECSVCLNGFQENESLRLLPKCSHAFHVPCIDTWLRSNKHYPLCRAPVVSNMNAADQTNSVETRSRNLGSQEEELIDRLLEEHEVAANLTGETRTGDENIVVSINARGGKCRVLSDLPDHRAEVDRALRQTVIRSISMDFSSTSTICNAGAKKKEQNPHAASSIYRLIKSRSHGCSI